MYTFEIPKFTLQKVKDLKPAKGLAIVAPVHIPDVQERESGLLVVTGGEKADPTKNFPIQFGVVIALGEDITEYQVGETIFFHKYSGQDGDMISDRFRMIRVEEIWGHAECELTKEE